VITISNSKADNHLKNVKSILERIQPLLFMDDWVFSIIEMPKDEDSTGDFGVMARISWQHSYKTANIIIYPALRKLPPHEIAEALLHESFHAFLGKLTDMANERFADKEELENATETIIEKLVRIMTWKLGVTLDKKAKR